MFITDFIMEQAPVMKPVVNGASVQKVTVVHIANGNGLFLSNQRTCHITIVAPGERFIRIYIVFAGLLYFLIMRYLKPLFQFLTLGEQYGQARKAAINVPRIIIVFQFVAWTTGTTLYYFMKGWEAESGIPFSLGLPLKMAVGLPAGVYTSLLFNMILIEAKQKLTITSLKDGEDDSFSRNRDYYVVLAILLFLIGGLMSYFGRVDGVVTLKPGDLAVLNQEYSLELVDFRMDYYPDGTVRRYVSEVRLRRSGDPLGEVMKIMVNHPLSIGRLKMYQSGYEEYENGTKATVLHAVYDPGYPPITWGAVLAVLGLAMIAADRVRKIYLRKE